MTQKVQVRKCRICGKRRKIEYMMLIASFKEDGRHRKIWECGDCEESNKGYEPKHGLVKHPLYWVWTGIKRRCYNKSVPAYKWYGAKGVFVYEPWIADFKAFYDWCILNGWRHGLQVDRYPNKLGGYEPGNIRFVTSKQNNRNRVNNRIVEIGGVRKTMVEWAEEANISTSTMHRRLNAGWSGTKLLSPAKLPLPAPPSQLKK